MSTREPTGLIELRPAGRSATPLRLGGFFAVWGQPLGRFRLAGFRGPVRAWLGGRPWRGDPRAIPLARHAQIVVEIGGYVPVHRRYRFPPGL